MLNLTSAALIGRQTLNTWTHATARRLGPIDQAIRAELLQATALEIDETPIDYQSPGHGTVREGRLIKWVEAKYRLGPSAAAHRLHLMKKEDPTLFAHWYLLTRT